MPRATLGLMGALLLSCDRGQAPAPPEVPAPTGVSFEHTAIIAGVVARIDDDGDGRVSPAEHQHWSGQLTPFAELDLDGSGYLEPAEVEDAIRFVTPFFHTTPSAHHSPG